MIFREVFSLAFFCHSGLTDHIGYLGLMGMRKRKSMTQERHFISLGQRSDNGIGIGAEQRNKNA